MIKRYSRKEMADVWEPQNKFQKWLDVEIAACKAHVELGNIPKHLIKSFVKKLNLMLIELMKSKRIFTTTLLLFRLCC